MSADAPRVLSDLARKMKRVAPGRSEALFTKFLPCGYELTTLSSVREELVLEVLLTKVRIGALITLYDDLADNPALRDGALLASLYRLPFSRFEKPEVHAGHPCFETAMEIWRDVLASLRELPHTRELLPVFEFDLAQFYNANRYSELITDHRHLANQVENRSYCPHNMGIILVGTVDLMASDDIARQEMGAVRAFLHRAQEAARLMNVLTTTERELLEGDVTGEILSSMAERFGGVPAPTSQVDWKIVARTKSRLIDERARIYDDLEARARAIRGFDALAYVSGLRRLQTLHEEMKGEI